MTLDADTANKAETADNCQCPLTCRRWPRCLSRSATACRRPIRRRRGCAARALGSTAASHQAKFWVPRAQPHQGTSTSLAGKNKVAFRVCSRAGCAFFRSAEAHSRVHQLKGPQSPVEPSSPGSQAPQCQEVVSDHSIYHRSLTDRAHTARRQVWSHIRHVDFVWTAVSYPSHIPPRACSVSSSAAQTLWLHVTSSRC